jgi:phenylalanyl-tRNA synthetase beta chain
LEEVARLAGYNNIPSTIPSIAVGTKLPHRELDIRGKIKRLMACLGYMEAINYSFMNKIWCDHLRLPPDDSRRRLVEILNPLTEDQTVMRSTLIPGLLATMHRNVTQQIRNLRFFETGKIFIDKGRDKLPEEIEMLCGLWTGTKSTAHWQSKPVPCDYYDIKGTVESLIQALKVANPVYSQIPADSCYYMRPGYAAEITIAGDSIGRIGEMHTGALTSFEIKQPTFMFELNLQKLLDHIPLTCKATPLSKFPSTDRDITIIVDSGVETGRITSRLEGFKEELVESIHVFDVFEGDPIPDGKKSVSFRITYRSMNETLHDEAINGIHKELTQRLVTFFDAALPV